MMKVYTLPGVRPVNSATLLPGKVSSIHPFAIFAITAGSVGSAGLTGLIHV
ncbi:hypothetical protein D3C72_401620 [compost metagenome]